MTATADASALTTSRAWHLDWIQRTIHRYSIHALTLKASALMLTVSMLVAIAAVGVGEGGTLGAMHWSLTAAVVLLFVMWMCDAHYHQQQRLYIALFDDVRGSAGESNLDMNIDPYWTGARFYNVLWEQPMSFLYVGAIIVLSLPVIFP